MALEILTEMSLSTQASFVPEEAVETIYQITKLFRDLTYNQKINPELYNQEANGAFNEKVIEHKLFKIGISLTLECHPDWVEKFAEIKDEINLKLKEIKIN